MTTPCPRCGSTDPAVRLHINILDPHDCDHPWHDRPTGADHDGHTIDVGPVTVRPTGVLSDDFIRAMNAAEYPNTEPYPPAGADPVPGCVACSVAGRRCVPHQDGTARPTGADDRPHMMQSVWPSTPGEATHALEDGPDPTGADDLAAAPLVTRIWQVLDDHGMGVVRKADMEALTARLRELEATLAAVDKAWEGYTLNPRDVNDRVERTRLLVRREQAR